jgi:hypothetical protein
LNPKPIQFVDYELQLLELYSLGPNLIREDFWPENSNPKLVE